MNDSETPHTTTMADQNNKRQSDVTVEDLLRFKREERPDEVFWDQFDRELHQRMLRTLVKKDPLYIQIVRGISGRIAQTAGVAAAAAVLAVLVVRPAFVGNSTPELNLAAAPESVEISTQTSVPYEVNMSDFVATNSVADYQIETMSASDSALDIGYTRDFDPDQFEVAGTYDAATYQADSAFTVTSVAATLVY